MAAVSRAQPSDRIYPCFRRCLRAARGPGGEPPRVPLPEVRQWAEGAAGEGHIRQRRESKAEAARSVKEPREPGRGNSRDRPDEADFRECRTDRGRDARRVRPAVRGPRLPPRDDGDVRRCRPTRSRRRSTAAHPVKAIRARRAQTTRRCDASPSERASGNRTDCIDGVARFSDFDSQPADDTQSRLAYHCRSPSRASCVGSPMTSSRARASGCARPDRIPARPGSGSRFGSASQRAGSATDRSARARSACPRRLASESI